MTTDITEKGLETLTFRHMTGADGLATADEPLGAADVARPAGGNGYDVGRPGDYDRTHALDVVQLFAFLRSPG